jgi:hypothetical protein
VLEICASLLSLFIYVSISHQSGPAYIVGAPVGGWVSDKIIIHARQARKGIWVPEDRLKAALPGLLFIIPVSLVFTGFVIDYIDGTLGLTLALIGFFINGFGVFFSPSCYIRFV